MASSTTRPPSRRRQRQPPRPRRRARRGSVRACAGAGDAGGGGFDVLRRVGRVIMEKASADAERLFAGASKTREFNSGSLEEILTYWQLEGAEDTLEELEDVLVAADLGPECAAEVVEGVREAVRGGGAGGADFGADDLRSVLRETVVGMLEGAGAARGGIADGPAGGGGGAGAGADGRRALHCVLVCGVNGAGKTTTMGKIANMLVRGGNSVMVVPGDTFRAAAAEQLIEWARRAGALVSHSSVPSGGGVSPATVIGEGIDRAYEQGADIVLCDTSGRLHTDWRLMDELVEVREVIAEKVPGGPHETLMVLDGTTGLNMVAQATEFHSQIGLTGLVLTKLDGTAKGGCVINVSRRLGVPIKFIGVGERMEDLQQFDARAFVEAIL